MKKILFFLTSAAVVLTMGACGGDKNTPDDVNGTGDGPKNELTVDEQKDYFDQSLTIALSYFNAEDQKHVIEVAEHLAESFIEEEWDLEELADFYGNHYDALFNEVYYVAGLTKMQASPAENPLFTFSFDTEALTLEADFATRVVKNKGVSKDGKYTLILKDGNTTYTAKVWGEGKNTELNINLNELTEEINPFVVVLPEKIYFELLENDTKLVEEVLSLSIAKDDHLSFSTSLKLTTLTYDMKMNLNATALDFDFAIKNNSHVLIAFNTVIPSLPVLIKKGNLSYEEWFNQYGEQWENLVSSTKGATFNVNLADRIQIKGKGEEGGKLYDELVNIFDLPSEKQMWQEMANIINAHAEVGVYFNSDTKQADVKMDLVDMGDGDYIAMPLFFFSDGSSFDVASYFDDDNLIDSYFTQINKLLESYEKLFHYFEVNFSL